MTDMDQLVSKLNEPKDLIDIIDRYQKNTTSDCDAQKGEQEIQNDPSVSDESTPLCPESIVVLLVKVIGVKPNLIDDDVKAKVVRCFKDKNFKVQRIITIENLTILHKSGSQLISWIKYESMLNHFIKEQIYEPDTMANEVLSIVKGELNPAIACKLASVIEGCVKHCRESSKGKAEEELDEKWCEIIDWMSWFLASKDDDFI